MNQRVVSSHFPYVPVHLQVRDTEADVEALVDSGFDGDIAVAQAVVADGRPPDGHQYWGLADGSEVLAPYYLGRVGLGQLGTYAAVFLALGGEPLIGRGLTDRFTVILDHGRQVIIEP